MIRGNRQPNWDKYEAALLLEAVLNVESGQEKKKGAIKRVSSILRQIALNRGLSIDDTYRNENGIAFQFQSMEFSAFGRMSAIHKKGSKLFDEVVDLYKNYTDEYNKVLTAAHALSNSNRKDINNLQFEENSDNQYCTKESFKAWLISEGKNEEAASNIVDFFDKVSNYANDKKIFSSSLLNIIDIKEFNRVVNTIKSYKLFRVLKKELYKFLQANSKLYVDFLKSYYSKKILNNSYNQVLDKETYIISDNDKKLFEKYGDKISKVYKVLKSNDRHVYLTIQQISRFTSMDIESLSEILEKSSWAEKLGDGYIIGQNNSSKHISFNILSKFDESTKIETILQESFRRGFRPASIMDKNRYIALYEEKYGCTIAIDDVIAEIQKSCFKFDDRFFLPKALVSNETMQQIVNYLTEYFCKKDILFYNVLYDAFEDKFESYIYSPEMLVAFLQKIINGTPIYYSDRYCSIKVTATPDIAAEVIDYLIKIDAPCSYEMIYEHFAHLNKSDIYNILHYNNPEILGNSKVEYFHVKTAHLTENELKELKTITQTLLKNSKFITCNEIMDNLKQINPALMERLTAKYSILGIRRIFTYYLRADFDVDTGIVTKKGCKMTVNDAFADFAKNHRSFTVDDVQRFADYMGTVPYWDTVHKHAVRVNATDFVSDSDVDFDAETIDSAINHYCSDYITLSEIPDYSRFPTCGFAWNIYLLQQYVFRFSKQFKLLSLGFTKGNVSGVIARKQSGFNDFDSVVIDALEKTKITSPNDAIQYLCNKGFIAEKRYKKHVELLKVAIARRNNR